MPPVQNFDFSGPQSFTAAQLVADLGISPQAARKALDGISPSEIRIVAGNPTACWRPDQLPSGISDRLATAARRLGCRGPGAVLALLRDKAGPWQPKKDGNTVLISDVAQKDQDAAAMLRQVMRPTLDRLHDPSLSAAERDQLGVREHYAIFRPQRPISARHFRALLARVLDRDRGAENWDRLEIYLPERFALKKTFCPALPPPVAEEFADLVEMLKSPRAAAADDQFLKTVWNRASDHVQRLTSMGTPEKRAKKRVRAVLHARGPFRNMTVDAIRKALDRNIAARSLKGWAEDGRKNNTGNLTGYECPEQDRMLLTAAGAKFGGGVNQGWQQTYNFLTPETRTQYPDRWNCPRKIRELIRFDVDLEKTSLKGPHATRTAGAFVNRDPNRGMQAGDFDQADDMTNISLWWEEDANDPLGFWFGQGQLLAWLDERAWFWYGFDLISDPYYDAFTVRNSWTNKAAEFGLPNKGLSLERGLWKTSRLIAGLSDKLTPVDPLETEEGLRRLGLRINNATHARGKVIERGYGLLQNHLQVPIGYVGRNPLTDCQEETKQKMLLVKSGKGKIHPADLGFLHKRQMAAIIERVFLELNDTPLHGKYHEGRTPRQVYMEEHGDRHASFPEELRWLLASHYCVRPVTGNGILIPWAKGGTRYKGEEAGRFYGQKVICWFNSERPETLFCTDMKREGSFTLTREPRPGNHEEDKEVLGRAIAQNAAQNKYRRELHRSLKPHYKGPFWDNLLRPVIADEKAIQLSKEYREQHAQIEEKNRSVSRHREAARALSRDLGIVVPSNVQPGAVTAAEARELKNYLREDEMEKGQES